MEAKDGLIKVFTGSDIVVSLLKGQLEEIGVGCLVRNDFQVGIHSGFSAGTPSTVYLFCKAICPKHRKLLMNF